MLHIPRLIAAETQETRWLVGCLLISCLGSHLFGEGGNLLFKCFNGVILLKGEYFLIAAVFLLCSSLITNLACCIILSRLLNSLATFNYLLTCLQCLLKLMS